MTADDGSGWLAAIRAREELLGEEALRRMAELFIEEVDPLLSEATKALRAGDTDAARRAIHHLGGSAGCLDFGDLATSTQNAERACVNRKADDALQLMTRISPLARQKADLLRHHFRIP